MDDQVRRSLGAVDGPAVPSRRQVRIVVGMCMSMRTATRQTVSCPPGQTTRYVREEIRCDVRDGSVAESVNGYGHALHDLVEWGFATPAVSLGRSEVPVFHCRRLLPGFVLLVRRHERVEHIGLAVLFLDRG